MSNIVIVAFIQYELVWDLRDKTDEHDHKEYRKTDFNSGFTVF